MMGTDLAETQPSAPERGPQEPIEVSTSWKAKLRFFWASWRNLGSLFRYDRSTAFGFGVSAYSPFSDEVLVRVSRFGLIEYEEWRSRRSFLNTGELLHPHDQA